MVLETAARGEKDRKKWGADTKLIRARSDLDMT
jgi:hypothetical protein